MGILLAWNSFKEPWMALFPEDLAASSVERLLWESDTVSQAAIMSS